MTSRTPSLAIAAAPIAAMVAATADPSLLRAWLAQSATQYRGPGARNAMRAIVLALLCPVPINVLLIGPPGTAKTRMFTAIAQALSIRAFNHALSPFTQDHDLLGSVDVGVLTRESRVVRALHAAHPTLLDALLVLLDEFPRSTAAIRAMVMRALADREAPDGSRIPAHVIVLGANTRLTSEEDRATVDRIGLRVEVPRLMASDDLRAVITRDVPLDGNAPTSTTLPALDPLLVETLRAQAATVAMPGDVADALTSFALALRQPAQTGASYPDVSERRWVLASRLLQANATLQGRNVIAWEDMTTVLPMVLDDDPAQRPHILAALTSSIPAYVTALNDLDAVISNAIARAYRAGGVVNAIKGDGDAHLKVDAEIDAVLATITPYGPDVATRAKARADEGRDAIAAAFDKGTDENRARRAAKVK